MVVVGSAWWQAASALLLFVRAFVAVPIAAPDGSTTVPIPASPCHDDREIIAHPSTQPRWAAAYRFWGATCAPLPD